MPPPQAAAFSPQPEALPLARCAVASGLGAFPLLSPELRAGGEVQQQHALPQAPIRAPAIGPREEALGIRRQAAVAAWDGAGAGTISTNDDCFVCFAKFNCGHRPPQRAAHGRAALHCTPPTSTERTWRNLQNDSSMQCQGSTGTGSGAGGVVAVCTSTGVSYWSALTVAHVLKAHYRKRCYDRRSRPTTVVAQRPIPPPTPYYYTCPAI